MDYSLISNGYFSPADELRERGLNKSRKQLREEEYNKKTAQAGGVQFSFRNTKTGMANDALLPYDGELLSLFERRGDIVIDSYDKLKEVVDIAFDDKDRKNTVYFGILDVHVLDGITNDTSNLPKVFNGQLFQPGRQYSIAATLDEIRHLVDEKSLTREEVVDYLDRMADTIIDRDSVHFDYYIDNRGNRIPGLLFKKLFSDGVLESFNTVSHSKKNLKMQTLYLERGAYQKKKSAKTPLMQNAPAHTPKARVGQISNITITQEGPTVKSDVQKSARDNTEAQLSPQQVTFFQNSQIRDAGGNLKVMYRGGAGDFTVFDRKKSSYSNLYGRGFYFTDSKEHAQQYGSARAFYLNIENPLRSGTSSITQAQLRAFLEAVAEDEDYGLENYGYGATVSSVLRSLKGKDDMAIISDINATCIGDMVAAVELFNEVNGTNYDGIVVPTETVAFRSEQIKLTDNTTPTKNPDIRYSTRDNGVSDRELLLDASEDGMSAAEQKEGFACIFSARTRKK